MATGGTDKKFLLSCLDPFHPSSRGVGLPSGSSTASYKASAVIRVDGQLDENGRGVIMFNPSVANDCVALWYNSGSNSISDDYPFSTAIVPQVCNPGDINPASTNPYLFYSGPDVTGTCASALPFSTQDLIGGTDADPDSVNSGNPVSDPPRVRGRVVSSGVKITFSGSTLNDGGVAYALVEPTHDSFQNKKLSTLQQYTATKVQRLALRNTIELVAFPCSRAQQEFSNAYDDMTVSFGNGVDALNTNSRGSAAWNISRYQVRSNGVNGLNMNPGGGLSTTATYSRTMMWEHPNVEKAFISVLYPLSRRNAMKMGRGYRWTSMYVLDSKVFWVGGPAPGLWANGAQLILAGLAGWFVLTFDGTDWYVGDPSASQPNFTFDYGSAASPVLCDIYCDVVTPPVFGAVYIQGGDQMANATFHVEYIVHCEYSGIGVQGRTTPNIPNEHIMDLALSAVDHARETSGQHESASFKHVALAAVEHVAAKHAPGLVQAAADVVGGALGGPVGAAFGEVAGGLVAQALKRHRR